LPTGTFAGFSLYIIYIAGRISEVAMAVEIIFFSLGGPVEGYTGAQTVIFAGSIFYFAIRNSEAAMGRAGAEVPRSGGCLGWAEGREILYFKASVFQWKDIRNTLLAARARVRREAFCFWK
jgi:hypothetical protein